MLTRFGPGDIQGGRQIADMPGTFPADWEIPQLREYPPPKELLDAIARYGIEKEKNTFRTFAFGDCTVFVSREPAGKNGEWLWHLSISHPDRYPAWEEMKFVRYKLLPRDLCFAILLPPPEYYVNVPAHDRVMHIWEAFDPREQWTTL